MTILFEIKPGKLYITFPRTHRPNPETAWARTGFVFDKDDRIVKFIKIKSHSVCLALIEPFERIWARNIQYRPTSEYDEENKLFHYIWSCKFLVEDKVLEMSMAQVVSYVEYLEEFAKNVKPLEKDNTKLVCQNCGANDTTFAYALVGEQNYPVDVYIHKGKLHAEPHDSEECREYFRKHPITSYEIGQILGQPTYHCKDCGEEDCVKLTCLK